MYTIGTVAKQIGVCVDTLRIWERKGLIKPARSGKNRVYSKGDLECLKRISHLLNERGMNIKGVKEVIGIKQCWKVKKCPAKTRESCQVYLESR